MLSCLAVVFAGAGHVASAQTLSGLALSPTSVVGSQANSTGTVTLSSAAPSGGVSVTLASSNTSAATVPASVTVASGATTATFTATSLNVTANTSTTITATYSSVSKTASLAVTAKPDYALTVTPSSVSVAQGSTVTDTVGVAYYGGYSSPVSLSVDTSTLPTGVTASVSPASISGSSTATITFTATSSATVSGPTSVTVDGSSTVGGHTKHVNLTVTAATGSSPSSLRIDCGSKSTYTDVTTNVWLADTDNSGGSTLPTTHAISSTSDPILYQSQRVGTAFTYTAPVKDGRYNVTLRLAEIEYTAAKQGVFNVTANGNTLLSGYDIFAAAGGEYVAVSRTFVVQASGGTGIKLQFTSTTGNAAVAAISVLPVGGGGVTPIAALPGSSPMNIDMPVPGWAGDVVASDSSDAEGAGPASSLAVSLPTGVVENHPGIDIWAFNPIGPSVSYQRAYRDSMAAAGYMSPGLSEGWTENYDLRVTPSMTGQWSPLVLTYPNGSQENWTPLVDNTGQATGQFTLASGTPYIVTGVPVPPTKSPNTNIGLWQSLSVAFQDHTSYSFTPSAGNANNYQLASITNRFGHGVSFRYNADGTLSGIYNDASTPVELLAFGYSSGLLKSVTDNTGRSVSYQFTGNSATVKGTTTTIQGLSDVSIVDSSPPIRWKYGYQAMNGVLLLSSVSAPDPLATSSSTLVDGADRFRPDHGRG